MLLFDLAWILGDFACFAIGELVSDFWTGVLGFFRETLCAVKQIVDAILEKSKAFIQKSGDKIRIIVRHFYRIDGQKHTNEETRMISRDEVPPDILELAENGKEVDITAQMELYV